MYIKDLQSGEVRKYGTNQHDSLGVSGDGTTLSYYNLQNGDGSWHGDYRFCDENGLVPEEDETLMRYGADAYFNIGGFAEVVRCKDCRKHNKGINEAEYLADRCPLILHRGYAQGHEFDYQYCSFGERGEEE